MNQDTFTPIIEDDALLMQYITKWLLELGMKPNLKGFISERSNINIYKQKIQLHIHCDC